MKKITATQERLIGYAQRMISKAKNEGIEAIFKYHGIADINNADEFCKRAFTDEYNELLQNIVSFPSWDAKHETLKKLEQLGYIEIINLRWNKVKFINY